MKGDYHNLHNHPHSWLSGTYYVNVPDQTDAEIFRNDLNPASISFFDPRPQANMNSIKNDNRLIQNIEFYHNLETYLFGLPLFIIWYIQTCQMPQGYLFHLM